jgi:hypothetical protein
LSRPRYQRESLEACVAVRVKESLVDVVAGIAISAIRTGRTAAGVRLYATTVALATSINFRIETPEQERYELAIVTARSTLGPEAFDAARSAGLGLSVDEMVADARGIIDGIVGAIVRPRRRQVPVRLLHHRHWHLG